MQEKYSRARSKLEIDRQMESFLDQNPSIRKALRALDIANEHLRKSRLPQRTYDSDSTSYHLEKPPEWLKPNLFGKHPYQMGEVPRAEVIGTPLKDLFA